MRWRLDSFTQISWMRQWSSWTIEVELESCQRLWSSAKPFCPMAERNKSEKAAGTKRKRLWQQMDVESAGAEMLLMVTGVFVYNFLLVNWCAGVGEFRPGILWERADLDRSEATGHEQSEEQSEKRSERKKKRQTGRAVTEAKV